MVRLGHLHLCVLCGLLLSLAGCADDAAGSPGARDTGASSDSGTASDLGSATDTDTGLVTDTGLDSDVAPATDTAAAHDVAPGGDAGSTSDSGPTRDTGEGFDARSDLGPGDPHDFNCTTNPANRYCPCQDLRDVALTQALGALVTAEHRTPILWDDSKYALFTDMELRTKPNGDLYAECIYTGEHHPLDGESLPDFDDFNIEHSWPKSLGAGSEPATGDLHHLFPVNSRVNSFRSSYHFGETGCAGGCRWADEEAGSALGAPVEGTAAPDIEWVFEVRPEFRGDIARAHFYFAVRYPNESDGGTFPVWEQQVLRQWHLDDPVDDWERGRNDGNERYQGNRNPFVDRPDFVERISRF